MPAILLMLLIGLVLAIGLLVVVPAVVGMLLISSLFGVGILGMIKKAIYRRPRAKQPETIITS